MLAIALVWFNFSRLDRQYPIYFGDGSFLGGAPSEFCLFICLHFDSFLLSGFRLITQLA